MIREFSVIREFKLVPCSFLTDMSSLCRNSVTRGDTAFCLVHVAMSSDAGRKQKAESPPRADPDVAEIVDAAAKCLSQQGPHPPPTGTTAVATSNDATSVESENQAPKPGCLDLLKTPSESGAEERIDPAIVKRGDPVTSSPWFQDLDRAMKVNVLAQYRLCA